MHDFHAVILGNGKKDGSKPRKPGLVGSEMESLRQAANRGEISFTTLMPDTPEPHGPPPKGYPFALVIGDDPEGPSLGPSRFPAAVSDYIRQAYLVAVYSGIGAPGVYDLTTRAAIEANRVVVIVQTQVEHHAEWIAFIRGIEPQMTILEGHPETNVRMLFAKPLPPASPSNRAGGRPSNERKTR